MSFEIRTKQANKVIELVDKYLWNKLKDKIVLFPYGYETHISGEVQELLKKFYTKTSLHIRFTPDFLLINLNNTIEPVFLLEYKTITTPRYTLKEQQWYFGQVEADAWDNYLNLIQAGINVIIFIYCSYYCYPYLLDYPFKCDTRKKIISTRKGSGTDYYNIDLRNMRDVVTFLKEEFQISSDLIMPHINQLINATLNEPILQTKHDTKSQYKNYKTGFNWRIRENP